MPLAIAALALIAPTTSLAAVSSADAIRSVRLSPLGRAIAVEHPGAYELLAHPRSTAGVLELELEGEVECHAVCFTPGLS